MGKNVLRVALILALVCSALPLSTPVQAGRCVCPQVYAPVECARGKIYPNQCVADCKHAKDCVPLDFLAQIQESAEAPLCEQPQVEETDEFVPVDDGKTEDRR